MSALILRRWDTLTKDVRPVPLLQHKGKDGWYVAMQLYSPFNQRDYCLERDKYDSPDQKTFAFTLRAVEHATVPVQAAYVRVTESYEGVALRQAGADGASTQFFVHYYDDLKGSSNAGWFQWIADKAVPAYYKAFLSGTLDLEGVCYGLTFFWGASACAKYHEEQKKIDRNAAAAANKAIGQGLEDAFRGAF